MKDYQAFPESIIEDNIFTTTLARENWQSKYQYDNETPLETFKRVAKALASVETDQDYWYGRFLDMMVKTEEVEPGKYRATGLKNTFGGRITANAGTEYSGTTLMNCYVQLPPSGATIKYEHKFQDGTILPVEYFSGDNPDSLSNIMLALLEMSQTLKSEGGYGISFGFIRPRGSVIKSLGIRHPGVVHYMDIWDTVSNVIVMGDNDGYRDTVTNHLGGDEELGRRMKAQARKGAMMGSLPIFHPDIEEFVRAKQEPGRLTKFNISVLIDNRFLTAVENDEMYDLWFPEETEYKFLGEAGFVDIENGVMIPGTAYSLENMHEAHASDADYYVDPYGNVFTKKVYKRVKARDLYDLIMESTYNRAEPGILFYDSMQHNNPISYINNLTSTNPCLAEGTLVATERGLVPVEEVREGDRIQTTLGFGAVSTVEKHDNTEVFRVKFTDGSSVLATAAHIFHSRLGGIENSESRKRWNLDTRLSDLKPGDYVRKDWYRFNVTERPELTRDMGLLYGLFLGDGSFSNYKNFNIATDVREDNSYIYQLFDRLGLPHRTDVVGNAARIYSSSNEAVKDIFDTIGVGSTKYNLNIKDLVNANPEFAYGVLDGLMSSDGNVNLSGRYPQGRFKNVNLEVHELMRHLLLMVGSDYKMYLAGEIGEETVIEGRVVTRRSSVYEGIFDNDSILNFYRALGGISHPEKNSKLKEAIRTRSLNGVKWVTRVESIEPAGTATVYDLYEPESDDWLAGGIVHRGCGEVGGFLTVCLLGNVNLTQYVLPNREFDWESYKEDLAVFSRALDNVNDITTTPLPQYDWAVQNARQYGLGLNGLGSTLVMMGIPFNSEEGFSFAEEVAKVREDVAWKTSAELAMEKGTFPGYRPEFLETSWFNEFTKISDETKELIRKNGTRNSKVSTNAPNGNTSVICDMTSNGIEPVFSLEYMRTYIADKWPKGLTKDNVTELFTPEEIGGATSWRGDYNGRTYLYEPHNRGLCIVEPVRDYGYQWVLDNYPEDANADYLTTTDTLNVSDHVRSQSGIQRHTSQSVSKTINLPNDYPFEEFKNLYLDAWKAGLNGLTTYRAGSMESVLSKVEETKSTAASLEDALIDGVKLPDSFTNGDTTVIKRENSKFYIHFSYHPEDINKEMPLALWVSSNRDTPLRQVNAAVKEMVNLLSKAKINPPLIEDMLEKIKEERDNNRLGRVISMALRHNVPLPFIIDALDRVPDVYVSDLVFSVKKFLMSHVEDGTLIEGAKCDECGSTDVVFESGCLTCRSCGNSNCA